MIPAWSTFRGEDRRPDRDRDLDAQSEIDAQSRSKRESEPRTAESVESVRAQLLRQLFFANRIEYPVSSIEDRASMTGEVGIEMVPHPTSASAFSSKCARRLSFSRPGRASCPLCARGASCVVALGPCCLVHPHPDSRPALQRSRVPSVGVGHTGLAIKAGQPRSTVILCAFPPPSPHTRTHVRTYAHITGPCQVSTPTLAMRIARRSAPLSRSRSQALPILRKSASHLHSAPIIPLLGSYETSILVGCRWCLCCSPISSCPCP